MEVVPTKTHITLLARPGLGSSSGPRTRLALTVHHRFLVTIFIMTTDASTAQSQLPHYSSYRDLRDVDIIFLSPVDISDLVTDSMAIPSQLVLIMHHAMPILCTKIAELC
ncbi:Glycosyltransferase [Psidium guajava]|nr:Glycosyltransferase [Psidium guajava]